jgi:hypothetical protein
VADLIFSIKDVTGSPVRSPRISLECPPGSPVAATPMFGVPGMWTATIPVGPSLKLEVAAPGYRTLHAEADPNPPMNFWSCDDPAVRISTGLVTSDASGIVSLARCEPATTDPTAPAALAKAPKDAAGAILSQIPGILVDGSKAPPVRLLDSAVKPESKFPAIESALFGDATKTGFGRFATKTTSTDPFRNGRLLFLDYGDTDPDAFNKIRRFLVAVWFPLRKDGSIPDKLDVICWFPPSTAKADFAPPVPQQPWSFYPFGARVVPATGNVIQPYVFLAFRHLFGTHALVHQLQAAEKDAAIFIPLLPFGQPGPFTTTAGWWRLVNEGMLHICRFGDPTKSKRFLFVLPTITRVVVAAFSDGGGLAQPLLGHASRMSGTYPDALWGMPDADAKFHDKFLEFWDLDTSFAGLAANAFQARREAEGVWFAERNDRFLRIYRSDTTSPGWFPNSASELSPAFAKLLATMKVPPDARLTTSKGDWAQQFTDSGTGKWTIARFSDVGSGTGTATAGYIGGPDGLAVPIHGGFLDGHELMPRIGFGHAAVVSGLAKRP